MINLLKSYRSLFIAAIFCLVTGSMVQAQTEVGTLERFQTGTIDTVNQDEGFIVIGGAEYIYRPSQVSVTYQGEEVSDTVLGSGIRLRFSLDSGGAVRTLVLLGPSSVLSTINEH